MSIKFGGSYIFLNKLSGFAFYLFKADEKSVIGAPELDVVREKVRIACLFDSFC